MTASAPVLPSVPEAPGEVRRRVRALALGVALAALLAHLGFVPGLPGWVGAHEALNYDDPQVRALADGKSVGAILASPTYYAYKPLYFLSLKLDLLFGDGVAFGLVENLLLFAFSAYLLVGLLHGLVRSTWLAGAAGLLFAVHPVHVESVAWLSGRKDLLSLLFVLLAHGAYRRRRDRPDEGPGISWGAALLLLLGGLSKGTVWTWAGVLALDEALEARRAPRPGALARLLPCLVVALGGIGLDAWIGIAHGPGAVDHGVSLLSLAAAMAGAHAAYVTTLLCPVGLSLDYAVDPAGSWASPAAWLGLALALTALAGLVVALRRGRGLVALALGIWILALAPVNNLWPTTTVLRADRYLVLAACGVYLLVAALLARAGTARSALLGVAAGALALLCVHRTRTFADSTTVWADAVEKAPHSALAWVERAHEAAAQGAYQPALEWASHALELAPRPEIGLKARLVRCAALLGLGRAGDLLQESSDAGERARALAARAGTREDPRGLESEAWVYHGQAFEALGERAAAREDYRRAVALDPESATAHYDLGTLLAQQAGEEQGLTEALAHLRRARALAPGRIDVSLQYAKVLAMTGHADDALRIYRELEDEHGRTPELLLARAEHFLAVGAPERAVPDLERLRREHPDHARAARLVYDLYVADGRRLLEEGRRTGLREPLTRALARFQDAQRAQRSWVDAWVGEGDVLYEQGRLMAAREAYRQALANQPEAAWIRGLVVRSSALEAAFQARHAPDDRGRRAAARLMADALAQGTDRIDLGLVSLEAELPLLRAAAATFARGVEPAAGWAAQLLQAAALLVVGDEPRAQDLLAPVVAAQPDDAGAPEILDVALLLRAGMRDRAGLLSDALADYALLLKRRPDDPAPGLRRLQIEMRAALARRSIAAGFAPNAERAREAFERLWQAGALWSVAPPLSPSVAEGLEEARGLLLESRRLAAADEAVDEVGRRIVAFAEAHPDVADAGLAAVEAEMRRDGWIAALRRLNALSERFPKNPSVLRGQAMVYETQFTAVQDRSLLEEARSAIQKATELDPRDPRTALDASTVRRLSGDRKAALALAKKARSFENLPGGPASRMVAALVLADGEDALAAGDAKAARACVEEARRVAPEAAGAWLLEGRIALERERDPSQALVAAMRAKELEPASLEVDRLLSRIHYQLGLAGRLRLAELVDPPHPAEKDPVAWKAMDNAAQQKAITQYEEARRALVPRREALRTRAVQNLEASLREDAGAEHADKARQGLDALRRNDPDEQRRRQQAAGEAYLRGKQALDERRFVDAYTAFDEVLALVPAHERATFYLVVAAHERLVAGGIEEGLRRDVTNRAFECLQALDALDVEGRFPMRFLYRGLLNDAVFRRAGTPDARLAAIKAFKRYLESQAGLAEPDAPNVELARHRMAEMERAAGGG